MLEQFFKSQVAAVSDPYQCNRITDALALRESSSIAKLKMSIGVIRSIRQELEL